METLIKNKINNDKKIKLSYASSQRHWVGNGFYVHTLLRPNKELNRYISPFILMDYASPRNFMKTHIKRGVGEHPHRGFETVTLVYQGEVEHHDSSGGGGIIKPGDVQWMTAGRGIIHNEFHSDKFAEKGGVFEMVQLWVNLPKKNKMTTPRYQGIKRTSIPSLQIGNGTELRVIAGELKGVLGPSLTFSDINIYDVSSSCEDNLHFKFSNDSNTIILILRGKIVHSLKTYQEKNVLIFGRSGENIAFEVSKDFKGLILNGQPINEPIFSHGPFVMNTRQEVCQAIQDFQNGEMGKLEKF